MNDDQEESRSRRKFDGIEWRILGWAADAAVGLLFVFAVWINLRLTDVELWQAATVANRYTSQDHMSYAAQQSVELNRIWLKIADMQAGWLKDLSEVKTSIAVVPQILSSPPQWWVEYGKPVLDDHSTRIRALENEKRRSGAQ